MNGFQSIEAYLPFFNTGTTVSLNFDFNYRQKDIINHEFDEFEQFLLTTTTINEESWDDYYLKVLAFKF